MTENQKDFLFKEYDKLNNEVAKLLEETRTREKYSLTTASVVATWIFTTVISPPDNKNFPKEILIPIVQLLSWIPLLITIMYGVSVLLIYKNIKWIGGYLSIIEQEFINNLKYTQGKTFGWENHFNQQNRKSYFVIWTWIFWLIQCIIWITLICTSYCIF